MKTLKTRFDNIKRGLNFKVLIVFIVLLISSSASASTYQDVTNFLNANPAPSGCVNWVEEVGSGYKVWIRCSAGVVSHTNKYRLYPNTGSVSEGSLIRKCDGTDDTYRAPAGGASPVYGSGGSAELEQHYCNGNITIATLQEWDFSAASSAQRCWVWRSSTTNCRSLDVSLADFPIVDQCLNKLTNTYESCFQNCKDPVDKAGSLIAEICGDGIDNNCDGKIDEGCCADNDGDGYNGYNPQSCIQGNDCNDNDPNINPATIWYKDIDNDKYSDGITTTQCEQHSGYKLSSSLTGTSGDCDDNNSALTPATIWHKDSDGDGYTDGTTITQCERPAGYKLQSELSSSDLDCDDNSPLVNLPSIWYKDTDNDGYSDGTTMTSCTRPIGFKPASELNAASGDNDDTDGTIYLGAPEICGDNKDNNQNGQTDEGCCNVSINISPTEVWPKGVGNDSSATATITVSLTNPAPSNGCAVNLSVEPVTNSGGHSQHTGTRPKGTITDSNGNVINSVTLSNAETFATAKYTSSEVSGEEKVIATATGNTSDATITVKVPGLQPLGTGAYHVIVRSGTNTHPEGTYGMIITIEMLKEVAKKYYELAKRKLSVNDLSLPSGGLFDLNGQWNAADGHEEHRSGNDADINRTDGGGVFKNCEDDKKLKEAVSKIGTGGIPTLRCESGGRKHIDFD